MIHDNGKKRTLLAAIGQIAGHLVGDLSPTLRCCDGFIPGTLHDPSMTAECNRPVSEISTDVALRRLLTGYYREMLATGELRTQSLYWLRKYGKLQREIDTVIGGLKDVSRMQHCDDECLRALRELSTILSLFPSNNTHPLDELRNRINIAMAKCGLAIRKMDRIDISRTFRFVPPPEFYRMRTIVEKYAAGWLGWPKVVKNHRGSSQHNELPVRDGDHIGHLIGVQFGAPDNAQNVSSQNGIQNGITKKIGWGNYFRFEDRCKSLMNAGAGIYLQVWTYLRWAGSMKYTDYRDVHVAVYHASGAKERVDNLSFANFPVSS